MRTLLIITALLLTFASKADQLAYITKEQAVEAAELISKMRNVYLFCGCCSLVEPEKVKVISAEARHTGYENYYEVILEYKDANGEIKTSSIDLAYVWRRFLCWYKTIGEKMELEHDPCVHPKHWDDPKNSEKDQ